MDIDETQVRRNLIDIKMHKTKRPVTIPLTSKATTILKKYLDQSRDHCFPNLPPCQELNNQLRKVASNAAVEKHISYPVSCHTFATMSLNLGIPIEIASSLLGRTDLRVTQVYAKVLDKPKWKLMMKWENL